MAKHKVCKCKVYSFCVSLKLLYYILYTVYVIYCADNLNLVFRATTSYLLSMLNDILPANSQRHRATRLPLFYCLFCVQA